VLTVDLPSGSDATRALVRLGPEDSSEGWAARTEDASQRVDQIGATDFAAQKSWLSDTDLEVSMLGSLPTLVLGAVPGMPRSFTIKAIATARSHRLRLPAGPPRKIDLSYEAADYNHVWAHCYDRAWEANGIRVSDEGTKF